MVADCTEAIRLDPDDSRFYLERAKARSGLKLYKAAIDDYDRVVRLDSDNPAAYLGRCQARSELGLHEEALEDYERVVDLDPEMASTAGDL